MKSAKYFATIMAICFSGYCFSQGRTLTINQFIVQELKEFDTEGDYITPQKLKDGFTLRIKASSQVQKAELKKDGTFAETNLPPSTNDASYSKIYKDIKINAKANDVIEIQIHKDGETPLIVKLTVGEDNNELNNTCIHKQPNSNCPEVKSYDNKFGEEAKFYDKKKMVYIYDFNENPSKREFYKITLKSKKELGKLANDTERAGHQGLNIQVVNFNRETLTSGRNVKFKIYNINKFMYDVSIADSVIHFDSEPSALFTRLFLGDSTLLGSLMGTFTEKIESQAEDKSIEALKQTINSQIGYFVKQYNLLQNKILDAYDPCYSFPCCYSIKYTDLANHLAEIRENTAKLQSLLDEQKKIVESNTKAINDCKTNKKSLSDNKTALSKLDSEIKKLEEEIKKLSGDDKKKKEEELENKRKENEKLKGDREKSEKSIADNCGEEKETQYANDKENAEKVLSDFNAINTLLNNLPTEKELKKIIVFLRNMVETNNSHTSDYISLNGNMLELIINIESKDSIFKHFSIPDYKNDPLQIQIPILRKPFVSFSSGSFMAIGKHLQNKTYDWQGTIGNNNIISDSNFTLVESGYSLPPMGFCALGNLEWKITRSFGLGGSAGVGLTIEKTPRMAYLGGGSLFFGDLRQFTITGGFVGMQIDKLTNNFQTVADNQVIYTSSPDIKYYKEFKVGGFVSLTYTPFKVYKTKTVKSKNK